MAVESIRSNVASMSVKPIESRPVSIEPVMAAATEIHTNVKEVQGSKQNMQEGNEKGEQGKEKQASKKQIESAVNHANNRLKKTGCQFSYHEETKRVSIKVIDKETDEVIREIPPEETLEMVEKMWELAGILVDEKR